MSAIDPHILKKCSNLPRREQFEKRQILSATLLSFKSQWRRLSHGSRHYPRACNTCLGSQLPWGCPVWFGAFDTRSMYLNSPYKKLRWYHLSLL